jgi:hypothetical protein
MDEAFDSQSVPALGFLTLEGSLLGHGFSDRDIRPLARCEDFLQIRFRDPYISWFDI